MVAGESGLGKSTLIDRWEMWHTCCKTCDTHIDRTLWGFFLADTVFIQPFPDWPLYRPNCSSSCREVMSSASAKTCCECHTISGWKEPSRSTRTQWRSRRGGSSWGWQWLTPRVLVMPSTPLTPSRRSSSTSTCSLTGKKTKQSETSWQCFRYLRDESGLNRKNIVDNRGTWYRSRNDGSQYQIPFSSLLLLLHLPVWSWAQAPWHRLHEAALKQGT